jgi:hypothetical protein
MHSCCRTYSNLFAPTTVILLYAVALVHSIRGISAFTVVLHQQSASTRIENTATTFHDRMSQSSSGAIRSSSSSSSNNANWLHTSCSIRRSGYSCTLSAINGDSKPSSGETDDLLLNSSVRKLKSQEEIQSPRISAEGHPTSADHSNVTIVLNHNDEFQNHPSSSRNNKNDKSSTNFDPTMPIHKAVQSPAGPLWNSLDDRTHFLPHRGRGRKRVLVLCTGGTLTMSHDPTQGNSLAPVQGALTEYLATMRELTDDPEMPEIVAHEYAPLIDSSDMGPGDWAVVAQDIATNYYHFGR